MTRPSRAWPTALAALCTAGAPRALPAQLSGALDAGVSRVSYDGFLPSAAVGLTPSLRFAHPSVTVTARATLLQFESGNRNLQGALIANAFTPRSGRIRGEATALAGASSYERFASFSHLQLRARVHVAGDGRGAWLGAAFGQASLSGVARPVATYSVGAWVLRWPAVLALTAATTTVGDTLYTDVETTVRWQRGLWQVETNLGARVWSRGGGRGVYGELTAARRLMGPVTLVAGWGGYPSDPTRGSISGRYATLGMRIAATSLFSRPARAASPYARDDTPASGGTLHFAARLELRRGDADTTQALVLEAPRAQLVEVAGDFTDWTPVPLARTGETSWEVTLPLAPGIYRVLVRLDAGPWLVPAGLTRTEGDFGEVGLLIVR